ncbi:MAG: glycine cleavage system protein GcvH [Gammaproteobacteria bacterium]|nr:glycine cleavage system protein GcvH [Gammaproteobacteria bacterium]
MASVNGCNIPEDLFYNVDSNVWASIDNSGVVTVGMTSYACSLSGQIVSYTAKKPGKAVKRDKSCATVESGKWVGPVKAPVAGEIIATNPLLDAQPEIINEDPYGEGWIVKIKASDWDSDSQSLVSGPGALKLFDEKMSADGFGGC